MRKIVSLKISPLVSHLNGFYVGDNYSKKSVIAYPKMVHSDLMNKLKIQQKLLSKGWNVLRLTYLQIAGRMKSGLKKENIFVQY